jgi:hypothetical protein
MPTRTHSLTVLALVALMPTAHAHHIWLETTPQGAALYFGEFSRNLRETAPGILAKISRPVAQLQRGGTWQPVTVEPGAKFIQIPIRLQAGDSLIAEDTHYPMSERKGDGDKVTRSHYHPAARIVQSFTLHAPKLKLDIVPTGRHDPRGPQLQVTWNNQPLAKAKVTVAMASGWIQELETIDDGTVIVTLPWQGAYVFEVSHRVSTAGERDGQTYDRASYVTALTVNLAKGLPPLPALPPATPGTMN